MATVGGIPPVKQVGLGLDLAIVVDSTVVRMLLVPAAMSVMGRANWWAPAPLRRLHRRVGMHEQSLPLGGRSAGLHLPALVPSRLGVTNAAADPIPELSGNVAMSRSESVPAVSDTSWRS